VAESEYAAEGVEKRRCRLGFYCDDFAVFPNVNGSSVHARGFARGLGGAAEGAANGRRKFFCFFFNLT
jgi:hypothetical protein